MPWEEAHSLKPFTFARVLIGLWDSGLWDSEKCTKTQVPQGTSLLVHVAFLQSPSKPKPFQLWDSLQGFGSKSNHLKISYNPHSSIAMLCTSSYCHIQISPLTVTLVTVTPRLQWQFWHVPNGFSYIKIDVVTVTLADSDTFLLSGECHCNWGCLQLLILSSQLLLTTRTVVRIGPMELSGLITYVRIDLYPKLSLSSLQYKICSTGLQARLGRK